jgi:hypothetical protein
MIHCCNARPPPRSYSVAGKARLITVESRNATIDTINATTIARLVGAASRNVTAGAVGRVTMTGRQTRCVRCDRLPASAARADLHRLAVGQ